MPPKSKSPAKQVLPPTDDQLILVQEYASQLHYAFLARPPPTSPRRKRWEKHFTGDLGRMLGLLATAKFKYLPSFAIGCIYENNRRLRAEEESFNPERVVDAASPGHPAYSRLGGGRLKYLPALSGPHALLPEDKVRNVWWEESNYGVCIVPRSLQTNARL